MTYGMYDSAALASRITHDKKALLRHINIYAEMAKEEALSGDALAEHMDRIIAKTTGVARLMDIERMLGVFAEGALPLARTALHSIVSDVLEKHEDALSGFDVDVRGMAEVAGVPSYLAFAVQELLSNVEEFAAEGARVSITLRQEPAPLLEVSHASSVVAGPEFFEPYAVGPGQKRPGAGLGLFMVAQIAAAHGGTCEAIDAGPEAFAVRLTLKPAAA